MYRSLGYSNLPIDSGAFEAIRYWNICYWHLPACPLIPLPLQIIWNSSFNRSILKPIILLWKLSSQLNTLIISFQIVSFLLSSFLTSKYYLIYPYVIDKFYDTGLTYLWQCLVHFLPWQKRHNCEHNLILSLQLSLDEAQHLDQSSSLLK